MDRKPSSYALGAPVLATAAVLLLLATPLLAGSLAVTLAQPGEATIVVVGPDGTAQTFKTSTGQLVITPKGGSGSFKITVTQGGQTETADVEVPVRGQILVVFDADAQPAIQTFATAVENVTVTAQRVEENLQKAAKKRKG